MDFDDFLDLVSIMNRRVSCYQSERSHVYVQLIFPPSSFSQTPIATKLAWAFKIYGKTFFLVTGHKGAFQFSELQISMKMMQFVQRILIRFLTISLGII